MWAVDGSHRMAQLSVASCLAVMLLALVAVASPMARGSNPRLNRGRLRPASSMERSIQTPLVEQARIPTKNLLGIMHEGGVLMYPIGFCSVVLLVFVFERLISLRLGRVLPHTAAVRPPIPGAVSGRAA